MKKRTISAKEIVQRFSIPYHTLNYYTAIGLLPILGKNGNQRIYDVQAVRKRLTKISKLAKEGYPLHLIRKKILGI